MAFSDEQFMQLAIDLAMAGRGLVEPNPMVGCVIVKNNQVIGSGIHRQYGQAHAEPNALANCTESVAGATAYVTLEPCSHTNKQTPPCAPRLIDAKVARVVVGAVDLNPNVSGQGIAQLREAGIDVIVGVLEKECLQLATVFIKRMRNESGQVAKAASSVQHRKPASPYVTLKWAQSANGKIAGGNGARVAISNGRASKAVHQLRANVDSILVGSNTVLKDDPLLTARGINAHRQPVRYVIDRKLQIPANAKVFTASAAPTYIFSQVRHGRPGSNLIFIDNPGEHLDLGVILEKIFENHHYDLLIESGGQLACAMLAENHVDRLWVIQSPQIITANNAPDSCAVPKHFIATGKMNLDGNVLTEFLNPDSTAFHTVQPSADFRALLE